MTSHRRTVAHPALATFAVAAAALVLAGPARAQAPINLQILEAVNQRPIPITECTEITEPGAYQVVQDLEATGDCLLVSVDDVTIDLSGFTLSGDGDGGGVTDGGTPRSNIAVQNGSVTGFEHGVDLTGTDAATVRQVRALANVFGIIVGAGSTVSGNTAAGNGNFGIVAVAGSTVSGNTARGNTGDGIDVTCPANVFDNTATENGTNLVLSDTGCLEMNNLAPSP